MCAPAAALVPLATLALTAAGTGYSVYTQMQARREQQDAEQAAQRIKSQAAEAERVKQEKYRQEAEARLNDSLNRLDPANQAQLLQGQQGQAVSAATAGADALAAASPEATALQGTNTSNAVVKEDLARQLASVAAASRERMATLGRLGGYEQLAQDNATALGRNSDYIDMISNLRKASLQQLGIATDFRVPGAQPVDTTLGDAMVGLGNTVANNASGINGWFQNAQTIDPLTRQPLGYG